MSANHDDYIDESLSDVQAGTNGIVITLMRGRSISGRVTMPDGQPAAGVQVSARSDDGGWEWGMTDTEGEFRVDGLRDGAYEINVEARGHPGLRGMSVPGVAAGTEGLTLRLEPGFTISGVVVDATGAPAAEVRVWASGWDGQNARDDAPNGSAQTDANGQFTIGGLDSGGYKLRAMARSGKVSTGQAMPTVQAPGGSEGVRLVLPAAMPTPEDEER